MDAAFLGIDTAQVNCGFSIVNANKVILFSETFISKSTSNILRNFDQAAELEKIIREHNIIAACVESPAFSASFGAFSIGMVHGVLTHVLMQHNIPFMWIPPTKIKYAFLGPGKWTKRDIIGWVVDNTEWMQLSWDGPFPHVDSNMADSILMAILARTFHFAQMRYTSGIALEFKTKWMEEIFCSDKIGKNEKPAGILLRPGDFYIDPSQYSGDSNA